MRLCVRYFRYKHCFFPDEQANPSTGLCVGHFVPSRYLAAFQYRNVPVDHDRELARVPAAGVAASVTRRCGDLDATSVAAVTAGPRRTWAVLRIARRDPVPPLVVSG